MSNYIETDTLTNYQKSIHTYTLPTESGNLQFPIFHSLYIRNPSVWHKYKPIFSTQCNKLCLTPSSQCAIITIMNHATYPPNNTKQITEV